VIVESTPLPGVLLVKPKVFRDDRGQFLESWRESAYAEHGMTGFVQDNISVSRRGVLRGMHLQNPQGQGKLVSALRGRIFDVALDTRHGSPTFGRWFGVELTDENRWQLYIPVGFAHGFQALTDDVVFSYKCTDYYAPLAERTVRWNDPEVAITWPIPEAILAPKDEGALKLSEIPRELLPAYDGH
jgi:dTDP-4-dehydrorhamnose 3,5-epimerase